MAAGAIGSCCCQSDPMRMEQWVWPCHTVSMDTHSPGQEHAYLAAYMAHGLLRGYMQENEGQTVLAGDSKKGRQGTALQSNCTPYLFSHMVYLKRAKHRFSDL